jgi:hypothetical protein
MISVSRLDGLEKQAARRNEGFPATRSDPREVAQVTFRNARCAVKVGMTCQAELGKGNELKQLIVRQLIATATEQALKHLSIPTRQPGKGNLRAIVSVEVQGQVMRGLKAMGELDQSASQGTQEIAGILDRHGTVEAWVKLGVELEDAGDREVLRWHLGHR